MFSLEHPGHILVRPRPESLDSKTKLRIMCIMRMMRFTHISFPSKWDNCPIILWDNVDISIKHFPDIQKVVFETHSVIQALRANHLSLLLFVFLLCIFDLLLSVSNILSVCSYMSVYEKCVFVQVYYMYVCMYGILEFLLI